MITLAKFKKNWKRYAFSTVITFVTGFSIVALSQINDFTLETIKNGLIWGFLFSALRGGIKAVLELLVSKSS